MIKIGEERLIFVGYSHSLIFFQDSGEVLAAGNDRFNRLSLGLSKSHSKGKFENFYQKTKKSSRYVEKFQNFFNSKVAMSGGHNLFLSSTGIVYCCGHNCYGELGVGDYKCDRKVPTKIEFFKPYQIVDIYASYSSFFVDKNGASFSCGKNDSGQLFNTSKSDYNCQNISETYYPEYLEKKVRNIYPGQNHTVILFQNNDIYSVGRNEYYQLGLGTVSYIKKLQKVTCFYPKLLKKASLGDYHTIWLLDDSKAYACGSNQNGECGNDFKKFEPLLVKIRNRRIIDVEAGFVDSFFLTNEGHVYSCGKNQYGELGLGHKSKVFVPQMIKKFPYGTRIVEISAGNDAVLFVDRNGSVYGTGYHHGRGDNSAAVYPRRLEEIKLNLKFKNFVFEKLLGFVEKRFYVDIKILTVIQY